MKLTAPKKSGNSTKEIPIVAMRLGKFLVEVAAGVQDDDEKLFQVSKEIRRRHNAYDGMLMELEESLKDLENWDGTPDAMEILKDNIRDRIKKAKK